MFDIAFRQGLAMSRRCKVLKNLQSIAPHNSSVYSAIKPAASIYVKCKYTSDTIYDVLRFTIVCDEVKSYWPTCKSFMHLGRCKNYWSLFSCYKGFHIQVADCVCPYEIQVHTKASEKLRNNDLHHLLYKRFQYSESETTRFYSVVLRSLISLPIQTESFLMLLLLWQDGPPYC